MEENQTFIPEGWTKQKGDNLFKVQGGYAFKSNDYKDEGVLLVRISNVGNNNFIYKDLIYVPKRFLTSHSNFLLYKDDVLMGLTGDLGKICILENGEFPFILNQRVGRFIFMEKVNNRFLYYLISSSTIQNKFDAFFTGGAQKNISPKQIESVEYVIPNSTREQQSIANILSKTDQAIANTEALVAKYTRIKTGLMQDLLTKGIDEKGNIRSEQTHEFKDSPLGRIPKEWECDYLSSKVQVKGGYAFKSKDFQTEGVQLIRIGNLYNNQLSLNRDPIFLPKEFLKTLPQFILNKGDIILSMTGTAGKRDYGFAVQINIEEKVFLNQRVCKFLFQEAKIDKDFLLNVLHSEFYLTKLYESVTGTKQANLNSDNILEIYVPFPIIDEQKRISNYLLKVDGFISKSKTELTKLQSLKIGLMQDLLTGKVRV